MANANKQENFFDSIVKQKKSRLNWPCFQNVVFYNNDMKGPIQTKKSD